MNNSKVPNFPLLFNQIGAYLRNPVDPKELAIAIDAFNEIVLMIYGHQCVVCPGGPTRVNTVK